MLNRSATPCGPSTHLTFHETLGRYHLPLSDCPTLLCPLAGHIPKCTHTTHTLTRQYFTFILQTCQDFASLHDLSCCSLCPPVFLFHLSSLFGLRLSLQESSHLSNVSLIYLCESIDSPSSSSIALARVINATVIPQTMSL